MRQKQKKGLGQEPILIRASPRTASDWGNSKPRPPGPPPISNGQRCTRRRRGGHILVISKVQCHFESSTKMPPWRSEALPRTRHTRERGKVRDRENTCVRVRARVGEAQRTPHTHPAPPWRRGAYDWEEERVGRGAGRTTVTVMALPHWHCLATGTRRSNGEKQGRLNRVKIMQALQDQSGLTDPISRDGVLVEPDNWTVGVDVLAARREDGPTTPLWDLAGQRVYLAGHSVVLSRRRVCPKNLFATQQLLMPRNIGRSMNRSMDSPPQGFCSVLLRGGRGGRPDRASLGPGSPQPTGRHPSREASRKTRFFREGPPCPAPPCMGTTPRGPARSGQTIGFEH